MDTLTSFSRNMGLKRSIPFAVRRWLTFKAVLTESSAPIALPTGRDFGTSTLAPASWLRRLICRTAFSTSLSWLVGEARQHSPISRAVARSSAAMAAYLRSPWLQYELEVPPFGQTGQPTVAVHMKASPATIHEGNKGTATAAVKTQRALQG